MEIENLKKTIITIREPRRISYGNIRHRLDDIIIIGLCTVICGGEDYNDMEEFGLEREEWLRTFLELPNGIPDSDTFRRLFERINPKELSECLYDWLNMERDKRSVVAIDGKTIRGSGNTEHKAYHVVSAFVAENQITLGEIVVDEKSNEITAVPELLDIIDVEGAIVTADAMSCQKDITKKITERKADYVLGLKDNQPQLKKDVSDYFFSAIQAPDIYGTPISTETLEKGHGRIEKREYFLITDTDWLDQKDEWSALNGIGMVRTEVDIKGEISSDTRYFITSLTNIITAKTGLVTFSGTNFKTIATDETDFSYNEALKRFVDCNLSLGTPEDYKVLNDGMAEGELIGGNLSLTRGLVEGKYKIDFKDKILFLEELGFETGPAMASNYLYYMKQNGVFNKIKGLWIGSYNHESQISLEKIILNVIGDEYNFPIIKSDNFGHIEQKIVIPIGTKARIDTTSKEKITLLEKCVNEI